jgi:hypothetical protein
MGVAQEAGGQEESDDDTNPSDEDDGKGRRNSMHIISFLLK